MYKLAERLMLIIGSADNVNLTCTKDFDKFWIHSNDYDTEFRFTVFNDSFVISRVLFQNQNRGTMTKCFDAIKQYHEMFPDRFNSIIIQSEETYGINQWSRKNGFKPVSSMCIEFTDPAGNGLICGDWKLCI